MKNKRIPHCLTAISLFGSILLHASGAQAQSAAASSEKVYSYVEQMPEFEGGETALMNFVSSNIQYPSDARSAGLEGLVVVSFVVETNGTVTDVQTIKSLTASTEAEAKRVAALTSGKWTTGRQNRKPTRVKYTLPVKFSLAESGNAEVLNHMPQFKGGQEAMMRTIYQNLKVPAAATKEGIAARMEVNFTVEADGAVSNITIADTKLKQVVTAGTDMDYMDAATFKVQDKTLLAQLSKAAAEAVQATSGMWEAGARSGKPVAAQVKLPVLIGGKSASTQLPEAAMLSYQADAYDKKSAYDAHEVDAVARLKDSSIEKFLAQNIRYPASDFEGTVRVAFIVSEDGRLMGTMADLPEAHKAISDEISRVFKMMEGKWVPAQKNRQPVMVAQEVTIAFVAKDNQQKPATGVSKRPDVVVTKTK